MRVTGGNLSWERGRVGGLSVTWQKRRETVAWRAGRFWLPVISTLNCTDPASPFDFLPQMLDFVVGQTAVGTGTHEKRCLPLVGQRKQLVDIRFPVTHGHDLHLLRGQGEGLFQGFQPPIAFLLFDGEFVEFIRCMGRFTHGPGEEGLGQQP